VVNLKPILPGHILVSPLRRVPRIADLTPAEVADLFQTVQTVSKTISRVFNATALNIAIQDGEDAGQSVPHVHAHVIPRRSEDLRERGGQDAVYDILSGEEGDVGRHLKEHLDRRRAGKLVVDADEERKGRSMEEMTKEAEWLAAEMAKDTP